MYTQEAAPILADGLRAAAGKNAGKRMRVHESGQCGAERQSRIGDVLIWCQQNTAAAFGFERLIGRVKDSCIAAEFSRNE